MVRGTKSKSKESAFLLRAIRSFASIVILTAFVLAIVYFVREVSNFNYEKFVRLSEPLLSRMGLDSREVGLVAGKFVERVSDTSVNPDSPEKLSPVMDNSSGETYPVDSPSNNVSNNVTNSDEQDVLFKISVFGDSHDDNDLLAKALEKSKENNVAAVFHLGDLTNFGVLDNLQAVKQTMDSGGLTYYVIPGDRDLYASVNIQEPGTYNFINIFKKDNRSVDIMGVKFVMLDNSANFTALSQEDMDWFKKEVGDADFVLLSQPLYHPMMNNPIHDHVMGIVNGEVVKTVRDQAEELLGIIRNSHVRAIIAAEQHIPSASADPVRPELQHIVVGAITRENNLDAGTPQFDLFTIYKDKSFSVEKAVLE